MSMLLHRLAGAALLLAGAALQAAEPAAAPSIPDVERSMLEQSNAFRTQQGLQALRPNAELGRAARVFADYMARTDRYGHTADGHEPDQRATASGYAHCLVAENIAWQYRSNGFSAPALVSSFVNGWIDSPLHRRNLLLADAVDMGLAVAHSAGSGRWYAVQMLARPASMRMRFELSNQSDEPLHYEFDGREFPLTPGVTRWHETCSRRPLEIRAAGGSQALLLQPQADRHYRIGLDAGLREPYLQGQASK